MNGTYFEQIAQELVKQKHLMEQLEAANRELRQQLADLRAGRGIFVEIAGNRFAVTDSPSPRDSMIWTR
jgi:cell division protein FtsB